MSAYTKMCTQCCNTNFSKSPLWINLFYCHLKDIHTYLYNKWSIFMTGLADVDEFKLFIQVFVWLGFPPLFLTFQLFFYKCRQNIWVPLVELPSSHACSREERYVQFDPKHCINMLYFYLLEHILMNDNTLLTFFNFLTCNRSQQSSTYLPGPGEG